MNYSLNREILASSLEPNAENFTLRGNLSNENTLYTFRVLVANDVGIIPTNYREICKSIYCSNNYTISTQSLVSHADTTDVQVVKVTLIEGANASTIQCEFIAGSDATGCMVVLIGFVAYHVNLTRNVNTCTNSAITTITLEHPASSYTGVEAFDIESDGSVGSLAVPGQLGGRLETPCAPIQTSTSNNTTYHCIKGL